MKEIEKKEAPDVSGGYRPDPGGGGCIPIGPLPIGPLPVPEPGDYPRAPNSPWVVPDTFVTDPPNV